MSVHLEGNGKDRLIELMRRYGHNQDVNFLTAKVSSTTPFAINLPDDPFDITEDLLIISQSILPHERKVSIDGGTEVTMIFNEGYIQPGDDVIVVEANEGQLFYVLDKAVT